MNRPDRCALCHKSPLLLLAAVAVGCVRDEHSYNQYRSESSNNNRAAVAADLATKAGAAAAAVTNSGS